MYTRILVALSSSTASLRGLDEAIRLAARRGPAQLRLVHVVDASRYLGKDGGSSRGADLVPWMEEAGVQLLQEGRQRAAAAGIAAQTLLATALEPDVAGILLQQARAWKAGLIVAGACGCRHGLGQVLRDAMSIPVLLVTTAYAGEAGSALAKPDAAVAS